MCSGLPSPWNTMTAFGCCGNVSPLTWPRIGPWRDWPAKPATVENTSAGCVAANSAEVQCTRSRTCACGAPPSCSQRPRRPSRPSPGRSAITIHSFSLMPSPNGSAGCRRNIGAKNLRRPNPPAEGVLFLEQQGGLGGHEGMASNRGHNGAFYAIEPAVRPGEQAPQDALLHPGLAFVQLVVGHQARQLGGGP